MTQTTESKTRTIQHNLILVFTVLAAVAFGGWQHSYLAALFMFTLEVWAAHLFAFVLWKGIGYDPNDV